MDIWDTWHLHFHDLPAVAHLLRERLPKRWLRIHSLPKSKRYAEGASEYAELLYRHNHVATEILGEDHAWVIAYSWGDADDFRAAFNELDWARRIGLNEAAPVIIANPDTPHEQLVLGVGRLRWTPGAWDDLLRDVADDRVPSIVTYNPRAGEIYAPYDGGADVFVQTSERVAELRDRWRQWLSARPDGL